MDIKQTSFKTQFDGKLCYTHARAAIREDGFGVLTTQPLRLTGCDVFYGMYISTTHDFGNSWSPLLPSKNLVRQRLDNGLEIAMCDATPMFHKKSGKLLLIGHYAAYLNDELAPEPRIRQTTYSVFDEKTGDFSPFKILTMPTDENETFFSCGNGCGQSLELPGGELLIPIYHENKKQAADSWNSCSTVSVLRCSFDGENINLLEIGAPLTIDIPRGLGEPSVVKYNNEYILALRNDKSGYVSKGSDGLNYSPALPLSFDNGENAGNYCTQQHWITGGGKLYMVYTRKNADNDHVFRHRAPLFIAEFDTERMCLIRESEKIAVPNRGARLGNFGCHSMPDGKNAYVIASEWMQSISGKDWKYCMEFGSDNSIFISHITF